jgi:hypothetical protein
MKSISVIKLNIQGQETWRYIGEVIETGSNYLILQAYFDREDRIFHGMPLCKGDRFIETYFTDRWYNEYEIHAREDDHLRGWYCNISQPAQVVGDTISFVDLALDLLVFPDGRQIILDENEFEELHLHPAVQQHAWDTLNALKESFRQRFAAPASNEQIVG